VVSLGCDADGKRIRRKVYGRTKTDVKDKLEAATRGTRSGHKDIRLLHRGDGRRGLAGSRARRTLRQDNLHEPRGASPVLALIGKIPFAS